jgi:hypothetical protein
VPSRGGNEVRPGSPAVISVDSKARAPAAPARTSAGVVEADTQHEPAHAVHGAHPLSSRPAWPASWLGRRGARRRAKASPASPAQSPGPAPSSAGGKSAPSPSGGSVAPPAPGGHTNGSGSAQAAAAAKGPVLAAAPKSTAGPMRSEIDAIDLLDTAGAPVLKRLAPIAGGVLLLLVILLIRRARR